MGIFRKREGFVTKGNRQIQNGDTPGAQQTIIKGLIIIPIRFSKL